MKMLQGEEEESGILRAHMIALREKDRKSGRTNERFMECIK